MNFTKVNIAFRTISFMLFFISTISVAQQDTNCKYKRIGEVIYESLGPVKIESDSSLMDGYIIFEVHKISTELFNIGDSTLSRIEIFFLKNLKDINAKDKRIFYNKGAGYNYAFADEFPFDTGKVGNKGLQKVLNTKDENFKKLKAFHTRNGVRRGYVPGNDFLTGGLTSIIFDTSGVQLFKSKNKNISYFIFEVKFFAGTFSFKSEVYIFDKTSKDKDRYVYFDTQKFFLPVSKTSIFRSVNENTLIENGFTKSDWFPDYLYKKCN